MKANELRIGNWIRTIYGMEFQVYPMAFKQMPTDKNHDLILDTWEPIPLTEEWLLKFGFKKARTFDHNDRWFIGENPVTHDWMMAITWLDGYSCPFYRNGHHKIQYVHQLQNLYFALTGKEL